MKEIGLVGWNTASGLGYLNRDIAAKLPIARWLIPQHPSFPGLPDVPGVEVEVNHCCRTDERALRDFLKTVDRVIICELPYFKSLPGVARELGVEVVLVAMAEWLPPGAKGWPQQMASVICPTRDCYRQISHVVPNPVYVPWPINLDRFPFRQRERCERFVFVHGTGGYHDRKGGEIVAKAAALAPECPLIVYTQTKSGMRSKKSTAPKWPSHVELRPMVAEPAELYAEGDVYIQPSRFEGLGLPLLEAQASGMPLVTTDGPPMNEYEPLETIRCTSRKGHVNRPTMFYNADPPHLAKTMREMLGKDVSEESRAARAFVESRSWDNSTHAIIGASSGGPAPARW